MLLHLVSFTHADRVISNSAHLLFHRTTVPGTYNVGHAFPMCFLSVLTILGFWPSFPAGFGEILPENLVIDPCLPHFLGASTLGEERGAR